MKTNHHKFAIWALLVFSAVYLQAAPMVIHINTNYSTGTAMHLPITGIGDTVFVNWGDGTSVDTLLSAGEPLHEYASEGEYTIQISGQLTYYGALSDELDAQKVVAVETFGDLPISVLTGAFKNYINLDSVPSTLPSTVSYLTSAFENITQDSIKNLGNWDVSNVVGMSKMFYNAPNFNGDLSGWSPSNVQDFSFMFYGDTTFNSDISLWSTDSVINMSYMFYGAKNFNQDINAWNVANVILMHYMFAGASSFNQNLNSWDVRNVTTMANMFSEAFTFNGNITSWQPLNVEDMSGIFKDAHVFNQNINSWNTSKVTNMSTAFKGADEFNQPLDNWDVSHVKNMSYMFWTADSFNQDLSSWQVDSVVSFRGTFEEAISFNGDVSTWNTVSATDMYKTFSRATDFNQNLTNWDVSNVTDMESMFSDAYKFNGLVYTWVPGKCKNFKSMFQNAAAFNQSISSWKTDSATTMAYMFNGASNFDGFIEPWKTSNVISMEGMFKNAVSFNQSLNSWDVSKVTNMQAMFQNAIAFNGNITSWGVDSVVNFSSMFSGDTLFNQNLQNWNTASVTDMNAMFYGATSFNQDISNWNIEKVTNLDGFMKDVEIDTTYYDSLLIKWNQQNLAHDLTVDFGKAKHTLSALSYKDSLKTKFNWTITDGGLNRNVAPYASSVLGDLAVLEDFDTLTVVDLDTMWHDYNGDDLTFAVTSLQNKVKSYIDTANILHLAPVLNKNGADTIIITISDTVNTVYDTVVVNVSPVKDSMVITWAQKQYIAPNEAIVLVNSMTNGDIDGVDPDVLILTGNNYTSLGNLLFPETNYKGVLNVPIQLVKGSDSSNVFNMTILVGDPMILTYDLSKGSSNNFLSLPLFDTVQVRVDWGDGTQTLIDSVLNATSTEYTNHEYASTGIYDVKIYGNLNRFGYSVGLGSVKLTEIKSFGDLNLLSLNGAFANADNLIKVPDSIPTTVTSLESLLEGCMVVSIEGLQNWNTGNITTMKYLAYSATNFNQDIGSWDVSNVANFYEAFYEAFNFNQNIGSWQLTSAIDVTYMFEDAISFNQNVNSWVMPNVTDIEGMFYGAESFNQPLDQWDVSKITNFSYLFSGAISFNQPIGNWQMNNAEDVRSMFSDAYSFNQDISSWEFPKVSSVRRMFENAKAFQNDISNWDVSNIKNAEFMFFGAELNTAQYDSLLIKWSNHDLYDSVGFHAGTSRYSSVADSARSYLINVKHWIITDGGTADFEQIASLNDLNLDEDFGTISLVDLDDYFHTYNGGSVQYSITMPDSLVGVAVDTSHVLQLSSKLNLYGIDTLYVEAAHTFATYYDTLIITINPINDIPVIVGLDTLNAIEDSSFVISKININYADVEADSVGFRILPGSNYSLVDTVITPDPNFNGALRIPVFVFDADTSAVDTLIAEVAAVNDVPVLNGIIASTAIHGDSVLLSLSMVDYVDVDGDQVFTIISEGTGYTVIDSSIILDGDYISELSIPVMLTDGQDTSATQTWVISVDQLVGQLVEQLKRSLNAYKVGLVDQMLIVQNQSESAGSYNVSIYNLEGDLVRSFDLHANAYETKHTSLIDLAEATYLVRITPLSNSPVNYVVVKKIEIAK